jgi:replicative DNA helicase
MAIWKHIGEASLETAKYIERRKLGLEKPLATCWPTLNKTFLGGIIPHEVTVIGGLSGSGKTLFGSQLETSVCELNPGRVLVLSFNFEMMARMLLLRKISAKSKRSIHELLSVEKPLSDEDEAEAKRLLSTLNHYPIYYVEKPRTVGDLDTIVREFNKALNPNADKTLLVSLDHTLLAKKKSAQNANDLVAEISEWVIDAKKELPVHFALFNQLNRNIESEERVRKPSILNYPMRSDLYYSETIYHAADNVIINHRPSLLNLSKYGPESIPCSDETLFMHYIKMRNGDPIIKKCRIDGKTMSIIED